MASNPFAGFPEVFQTTSQMESAVRRAMAGGHIRRIRQGLYTTNLTDPIEVVLTRNRWPVVGLLFPGSLVSHRTAFEAGPSPSGTIFLTGPYDRILKLPGLRIRQMAGPKPLGNDMPFVGGLFISSQARRLLECLDGSPRGDDSPYLPLKVIEESLERQMLLGEDPINRIRDSGRTISENLQLQRAFTKLDGIIGTLLGTHKSETVKRPVARARAAGKPYDPHRLELFEILFAELQNWPTVLRPDTETSGPTFQNIVFFDAYFSNYIEGTRFEVDEAIDIVFKGKIPRARPNDAHDVLGTYQLVGNPTEMTRKLFEFTADEFTSIIKRWHTLILGGRADARPGLFKEVVNVAGGTRSVEPQLTEGTLAKGFEFVRSIPSPFGRSTFLMFLISEVHPFDDGNGRVARAVANAELISHGERRIIVPTVFRTEYLDSLRDLTREKIPTTIARMMDTVQDFSYSIDFSNLPSAKTQLQAWNAFSDDSDSHLRRPQQR